MWLMNVNYQHSHWSNKWWQRCIQSASLRPGTHSFFFWTQRILNEGSNSTHKKIECLCKLQTPGKNSITRYATLGFVKTIFINWLTLHGLFRCKFSDLSRKAIVFSHPFPQLLVLSLLCLNSHVLRDVIWVVFWWDNRWHCQSANNNLSFQSTLRLLHAFQANFKL